MFSGKFIKKNGKLVYGTSKDKTAYDIFIEHHMEGFSDLGDYDSDIPNEMDDMTDEDNEHQPDDNDYVPSASETESDEEDDDDSSVSGNECEEDRELQEEELIDRDIIVWGKRKVAMTDSDDDATNSD